ncbi:hypothetical protein HKBW3S34_00667 [Candidatus Hakubella thermalkaliphila]|nr:hypothetical protein HKBW3S34_00667 [Candidatus Hakubella thermalkaliphila]
MENQERFEIDFYLDKETGEVIVVAGEILRRVEEGDLSTEDLPGWQKDDVKKAEDILFSNPERYERIPEKPSYEGYNLMVEFAESVKDEILQEKLWIALDGKGAFRRFKNVLLNYPDHRERWFKFKRQRLDAEVIEWLESIGISPQE